MQTKQTTKEPRKSRLKPLTATLTPTSQPMELERIKAQRKWDRFTKALADWMQTEAGGAVAQPSPSKKKLTKKRPAFRANGKPASQTLKGSIS